MDKALENAWQGLIFHIEGMQTAGEVIPKPSTLENIMQQETHKKAMPAAVKIIMPTGHMKRVNISMDVGLLNEIDMAAKLAGRNRSELLTDAARYMLT